MLKYILPLVIAFPAAAEFTEEDIEFCSLLGDLAETIMVRRQEGVAMRELLTIAGGNELVTLMVRGAYDVPLYRTPAIQEGEVRDFADLWEVGCFEARADD